MSLAKSLTEVKAKHSIVACKLGHLLLDEKIPQEDRDIILEILETPLSDPARVSHATLAKVLRQEGFDISKTSIDRHKNQTCTCYRKVTK